MIETETQTLGTIDVSDKLIVTDPCYIPDCLDHGGLTEQLDVRPGQYEASIQTTDDTGGWGNRVASLRVERIGSRRCYRQYAGRLAVDSGQMMFLSADKIGEWKADNFALMGDPITEAANVKYLRELTYNGACLATLTSQGGILADAAAVSSTGYGDGMYDLSVDYDDDGLIVAAEVTFIEEWDEDEDDE